jgi:plastocyanin
MPNAARRLLRVALVGTAALIASSAALVAVVTPADAACHPSDCAPPDPPVGVTAGAGDGKAEVSWIAPAFEGGGPLDHYTVTSVPDAGAMPLDVPAGTTTVTVPGLANGTAYTFNVTASNAGTTSDPSAPSNSVTPQAGAADPETATADEPAGGTLSTGASATSADPTNTTVGTPNAGIVSIGEGAMTGSPPAGVSYVGQQIDVTAPDAAAADPMKFTFVLDCSALPTDTSSCGTTTLATLSQAAVAASADVTVNDGSYTPAAATVDQGGVVTWKFAGTKPHSVVDSLGLGAGHGPLFASGNRAPGQTYSYRFAAAGQYPYRSTTYGDPLTMKGTVDVPIKVSPATGAPDSVISVTWSASSCPTGFRYDVQYRFKPTGGAFGAWKGWRTNTVKTSDTLTAASLNGPGDYQFRSRLENIGTGKTSGWSRPASLTIVDPNHLADIAVYHETETGNVEVPDCTGAEGVVQPGPACTWSEKLTYDGDLEVVVYTTINNRWRVGKVSTG